jgi:hypothetical protein
MFTNYSTWVTLVIIVCVAMLIWKFRSTDRNQSTATQISSLQAQIETAIKSAASSARSSAPSDMFGFALCTDDDIRTLFHVSCTREWAGHQQNNRPDSAYIYTEWLDSPRNPEIDSISESFAASAYQKHSSAEEWASARDKRFAALVSALRACRDNGVFDADTLLVVGSTDPSEHLAAMTMKAVDSINKREVADRFAKALGYTKYR